METVNSETATHTHSKGKGWKWKIIIGITVTVLIVCVAGAILLVRSHSGVKPPRDILEKVGFPLYIPQRLPGTYKVDDKSYNFDGDEKVLVFRATDAADGAIAITEQGKPSNFNPDDFYKSQLKDAKTVNGVKYPAVIGKGPVGDTTILSIITDKTWIMVTTTSPVGDSLDVIAKSLKEFNN